LAINSGDIQRIGRGNRVSYRMPNQPNASKTTDVVEALDDADVTASSHTDTPTPEVAELALPTMIPTPDDSDDALLPPLELPAVIQVADAQPVASPARGRRRATAKSVPEHTPAPAPAKARRKDAVPSPVASAIDELTAPSAPEPTAPKTPRRRAPKKPTGEA
jgi:hypothetical protein